jgi:RNA polymerase sigma-70 factor (ECF subfamily)
MTEAMKARLFQEMIMQHLGAAYNLARWLTRNDADAQDVVQEACIRAFRFIDRFHGENARPWLLAIVRNTCYSWLQKHRAHAEDYSFDEDMDSTEQMEADFNALQATGPEAQLLIDADRQIIDQALAELPVEFREVVVLKDMEDLSYKEIAEIANIPIGTVMSRLSRARRQLRTRLLKEL